MTSWRNTTNPYWWALFPLLPCKFTLFFWSLRIPFIIIWNQRYSPHLFCINFLYYPSLELFCDQNQRKHNNETSNKCFVFVLTNFRSLIDGKDCTYLVRSLLLGTLLCKCFLEIYDTWIFIDSRGHLFLLHLVLWKHFESWTIHTNQGTSCIGHLCRSCHQQSSWCFEGFHVLGHTNLGKYFSPSWSNLLCNFLDIFAKANYRQDWFKPIHPVRLHWIVYNDFLLAHFHFPVSFQAGNFGTSSQCNHFCIFGIKNCPWIRYSILFVECYFCPDFALVHCCGNFLDNSVKLRCWSFHGKSSWMVRSHWSTFRDSWLFNYEFGWNSLISQSKQQQQ